MDVSAFLGGRWLRHQNLQHPYQICTITKVDQQTVGQGAQGELKICVEFAEFPGKPLALNITNLARAAQLFSTEGSAWVGKQLLVYRSATTFQGQTTLCVRVCGAQQVPPDPICDPQGSPVLYQPQQPSAAMPAQAAAPAPQTAPVAAPAPQQPLAQPAAAEQAPWEQPQPQQQNSPPAS